MKELFKKIFNRETITYVIFGVLTTLVNFVAFKLFDMLFTAITDRELTLVTNVIAWIIAVAFAYVTNKLFVFESKSWDKSVIGREIPAFAGARLFSLGVEELGLFIFINCLHFERFTLQLPFGFSVGGKMLVKIGLSVIVIILNYFFSKLVIFKKKKED